ncbi:MAG: hypothetical protein LBD29_07335 [Treponema sp.]|jgi:hypothetical protein|nr:hypothetical protein [Treponema sp.]
MNNIIIAVYGGRKEFNLVKWSIYNNKYELRSLVFIFLRYLYIITLGGIPLIFEISSKFLARFARTGINAFTTAFDLAVIFGNSILLPLIAVFLVKIGKNAKRKITPENRLLFFLAGIGMCALIFILPLMPGGQAMRSQFTLPFAAAFMMFYLITECKKYFSRIIFAAALLTAFYQAQTSAQLFYSDQIRYMADVQLAIDLDKRITAVQQKEEKLPVALIGEYSPTIINNYIRGEALGISVFERGASDYSGGSGDHYSEAGNQGLPFMRSLGLNYELADYSQSETARTAALDMPAYPDPGCVKRLPGVIVVKLSDSIYRRE